MKEKMPGGVRFLFVILTILLIIVCSIIFSFNMSYGSMIAVAVIGIIYALIVIFICKGAKKQVMILPVLVGFLFVCFPVASLGIGAIAAIKEKKAANQTQPGKDEIQEILVPPTYVYSEHYVSSPDVAVMNKAEYYERYEMLNQTYSMFSDYSGTTLGANEYTLSNAPIQQTGRFEEYINPNFQFDINNVITKYARKTYLSNGYNINYFDVRSTISALDLSDTDVLEGMYYQDSCHLSIYPYRDFSFTFEFYRDFTFDGIELRVSQYVYFNNYGYPEREEILWVATCEDAYSSAYVDQKVLVYTYTQRKTITNA